MTATFKIGDRAVYPSQGVAEVVGIESKEISGNEEVFYVLKILDTQKKILVPLSKAESVGLRQVIGSGEVAAVIGILQERNVPTDNQTWNRRYRRYLEKIKTGSVFDVAEVLRDLNLRKFDKTLSFGERKMLDTARSLLVQEISVATARSQSEVEHQLEGMFAQA
jgi:CarD family transcriptional regulator